MPLKYKSFEILQDRFKENLDRYMQDWFHTNFHPSFNGRVLERDKNRHK